jgi:DNA-binding transcriptional LysR family regulator
MKASVENESRLVLFSTVPFEGDPPRKEIYIVFRNGMLKHPSIAAFVDILLSRPH